MTMNVQGPDGAVVAFPDGTDSATIDRVMRENFASKAAPAPAPAAPLDARPNPSLIGDMTAGFAPATPEQAQGVAQANARGLGNTLYEAANAASLGLGARAEALGRVMGGSQPNYDTALTAVNADRAQREAAAPGTGTVGSLVGGLGSGLGAAKMGLTTLPLAKDAGLLAKMGLFGAEGAGWGAAQGAGNTYSGRLLDYKDNAIQGALTGGALGMALPAGGSLLGKGFEAAAPWFQKPIEGVSAGATARLSNALAADGDVAGRLSELGPNAMLADAGPNLMGLGQGVMVKGGEGAATLGGRLKARDAGGNARIQGTITDELGPAPVPSKIDKQLEAIQGAADYDGPLKAAGPIDTSDALAFIGENLKTARGPEAAALRKARDMLMEAGRGGQLVPVQDARTIQNTKIALQSIIKHGEPQLGIGAGALNQSDGTTRVVVGKLGSALGDQVPGYSAANDQFRAAAKAREQLVNGGKLLDSAQETVVRPEELADRLATMPLEQQATLRAGLRAEIDRLVGTTTNDRTALKRAVKGDGSWNRDKLAQLYGPESADRLIQLLEAEAQFADTNSKLVHNSQSAQRLEAAKQLDAPDAPKFQTSASPTGLLLRGAQEAFGLLHGKLTGTQLATIRAQLGDLLSRQGGQRDMVIEALRQAAQSRGDNGRLLRDLAANPAVLQGLLNLSEERKRRPAGLLGPKASR